jgi:hypothetical protein
MENAQKVPRQAVATKAVAEKGKDERAHSSANGWSALLSAIGRFADKFGASFTILVILFIAVWFMGTAKTKDDFLREILFADVTHGHWVQAFFILLAFDAVFGVTLARAWLSRERRELTRCAEEKAKLQEMLAGKPLAHTSDVVAGGNNGEA